MDGHGCFEVGLTLKGKAVDDHRFSLNKQLKLPYELCISNKPINRNTKSPKIRDCKVKSVYVYL